MTIQPTEHNVQSKNREDSDRDRGNRVRREEPLKWGMAVNRACSIRYRECRMNYTGSTEGREWEPEDVAWWIRVRYGEEECRINYDMCRKSLQTGERRPERTARWMEHWSGRQRTQDGVCSV